MKKVVKAQITWTSYDYDGRVNVMPVGTQYCPRIVFVSNQSSEEQWSAEAKRGVARSVDFNQGLDARKISVEIVKRLAEINVLPVRIAFDHWGFDPYNKNVQDKTMREYYEAAVRLAHEHGFNNFSNYVLFNTDNDTPEEFYYRLELNAKLLEVLGVHISSFPMRYQPLDDQNYFDNRKFIGEHWNKKYISAIQFILSNSRGVVVSDADYFRFSFGRDVESFKKILLMPEALIKERHRYDREAHDFYVTVLGKKSKVSEEDLARDGDTTNKWWNALNALAAEQRQIAETIIFNNDFSDEILNGVDAEQEELVKGRSSTADMTFAALMELWLESIDPRKKAKGEKKIELNTFGGYQSNVTTAIIPWFRSNGVMLRDLNAAVINAFYKDCLKTRTGTTVHKYHVNIGSAVKFAFQEGFINSAEGIITGLDAPEQKKFRGEFLRQSEAVALFNLVKGHKLELGVILGALYGLRREEIIGLRWQSIDFEANSITIEHTVVESRVDGKRVILEKETMKTASSLRTLPLMPVLRAKLLQMKAEQEHYRKLCGRSYSKKYLEYVYVDVLGERVKPGYLSTAFPEYLEKHSFKRIRFHDLRHSCASLLLANGVSLKQIQEWLGHSTFKTTADIYAHLDFDSKKATAASMAWAENTSLGFELAANKNNPEKEQEKSQ